MEVKQRWLNANLVLPSRRVCRFEVGLQKGVDEISDERAESDWYAVEGYPFMSAGGRFTARGEWAGVWVVVVVSVLVLLV